MSNSHNTFEHLRSQTIDSLNLRVEEYRHKVTGAQHVHLATDNSENVFLVALRTVPQDSRGVAHILEHTALCGSEKYPVRDPFFMMIRRSLNTFMNAFTSADWTAYPFASQNRKDFDNLLDVYLDAVFFSNLDELDFAQEGHRLEFKEPDNPQSPLTYKGVVFNEMKGAMSSVPSQLWQSLCRYLYPTTTYHHNSGGDPEHIPDLTYEQLTQFYKTHYHPSNAIFMTYGDISAEEHQQVFEEKALHRFKRLDEKIAVEPEKRYHAPIKVEEAYALEEGEDPAGKTHVVMGWLLGNITDLEHSLEAQLLTSVLLDNSASPLMQALETSELGQAPSPLCGIDDSQYELAFACGLEGCELEQVPQVEQMILQTLESVANEGVPQDLLESALHQLELQQREVGGDGFPYGLQLIMNCLPAATHRADPIALLDMDSALVGLREKVRDPDFIPGLVRRWLLDNPHRLRLTLRPDADFQKRADAAEQDRLDAVAQQLTDDDRQHIVGRAKALVERQNMEENNDEILPKVGLDDIALAMPYVEGSRERLDPDNAASPPLRRYGAGTNGLVYQQVTCKLPALSEAEQALLPLYANLLTEVGLGGRDYLETQRWQAGAVGGISASSSVRGTSDDVQKIDAYFSLGAKALQRNTGAMNELLHATLTEPRFDELARLRELVAQLRSRREQGITGSGHSLAMTAACAGMAPAAKLAHNLSGLGGLRQLKALDKSLDEPEALAAFAHQLADLHERVREAPREILLIGEPHQLDALSASTRPYWPEQAPKDFTPLALAPVNTQVREAWLTNTQVNFCAQAYPTVPSAHPDAAALTVLAGFLRNGYLHRTIREQGGAYGGGATQDNNIAAFRFFSYRDPRLGDTLKDFEGALEWLLSKDHPWQPLEEAILGVISSIDKPGSPAGQARETYQAELFGRTREKREQFRSRVLNVTQADMQRVARDYLKPERASTAVVSHNGQRAAIEALGLTVREL